MGMTIEKSINGIEKRILPIYDNDADHEALIMAIDTMRKYQKIEQIVNNIDVMTGSNGYACAFIKIREVIKDGDVD